MAAAALLLLVGAGCGKADAGTKIDGTASQITGDAAPEQGELMSEEQDAAQVDNDRADVSAYGDAGNELAGTQSATDTAMTKAEAAGYCKGFAAAAAGAETRLEDGTTGIRLRRAEADTRLEDLEKAHDLRIADMRGREDEKRSEHLSDLTALADTDAKKQALDQFQSDIAEAVRARRDAVDAANVDFRTGLQGLMDARRPAVDAATSTLAASVRQALANAESDCASKTAPAKIRETLLAALKAARDRFQADLQDVEKLGPQLQTLIDTRKTAQQKASDDFQAAVDAAKGKLKAAFGA